MSEKLKSWEVREFLSILDKLYAETQSCLKARIGDPQAYAQIKRMGEEHLHASRFDIISREEISIPLYTWEKVKSILALADDLNTLQPLLDKKLKYLEEQKQTRSKIAEIEKELEKLD